MELIFDFSGGLNLWVLVVDSELYAAMRCEAMRVFYYFTSCGVLYGIGAAEYHFV